MNNMRLWAIFLYFLTMSSIVPIQAQNVPGSSIVSRTFLSSGGSDKMHGLDTCDYGARQYNPVTARWDRVDPLSEKYYAISPYVYCENNPVMYIDPDGKESMRANGGKYFKRIGILTMAGGALMVAAGTAYSIVTSGGGTVAGGGQLVSAGVATFKAGFVTYGAGVALDAHESIKKPDSIKPSDVSQKAHTPKKQSTGSKKKNRRQTYAWPNTWRRSKTELQATK